MGLEQYIINFVSFVNNLVIPFLLGIAFLVFVINVFRFFIVGGANADSKEKARALAVYGVLAFVLIMIFWGIVGLLTSSLGLNRLATSDTICFDYDPLCNDGNTFDQGPRTRAAVVGPAGNPPTSQGPTTRASTIPDTQDPGPSSRAIVTNNTDLLGSGGPSSRPEVIGTAGNPGATTGPTSRGVIDNTPGKALEATETVTTANANFVATLSGTYDERTAPIIEQSVDAVNNPNTTNEARAIAALRLADNGLLTEDDLARYIGTLDANQRAANRPPLDMPRLRSSAQQPPAQLTAELELTQNLLADTLADSNRSWLNSSLGLAEPNGAARADARSDVASIYNAPAGQARVDAFDTVIINGSLSDQAAVSSLRTRLINDINAERFFAGQPPLTN